MLLLHGTFLSPPSPLLHTTTHLALSIRVLANPLPPILFHLLLPSPTPSLRFLLDPVYFDLVKIQIPLGGWNWLGGGCKTIFLFYFLFPYSLVVVNEGSVGGWEEVQEERGRGGV